MFYYAQLDENNVCFAVTEHSMPISGENIIELPSATYDVLGKKYEEGKWIDNEILPQPTQLDRIEEALSIKNEDIANNAVDAYTLELIEKGVL